MPEPNEVRVSKDGRQAIWTGSQWMINPNPNAGVPSGRTDAEDFSTFKNGATTLGALASLLVPGGEGVGARVILPRIAAAMMGGGTARGTASAMTGGDVPADVGEGVMAGGAQEAAPLALGPLAKYGGKGLQWLASMLGAGDKTGGTGQAVSAGTRAFLAHEVGLGPEGVAASVVVPPVANAVGKGMERAGGALEGKTTSQHILNLIDRFTGGGADEVAPRTINPDTPLYKQMEELPDPSRKTGPSSGFSSGRTPTPPYQAPPTPAAMRPRVVGKTPTVNSVLDDAMQGLKNDTPPAPLGDTPSVRSVDRGNLVPAAERSGAPAQTGSAPNRPLSDAELFNINRSAPYGEGAIIPQSLPTELKPLSLQGLEDAGVPSSKPYDLDYMDVTGEKYMPHPEVVSPDESGLFDEQPSDRAVQQLVDQMKSKLGDVPAKGAVPAQPEMPSSWQQFTSGDSGTHTSGPQIDLPPSLKSIDNLFGPGATDMGGESFQSTTGYKGANNLLYDPQTPTSYLRDQLSSADDPAERDFLAKSLRQRLRLGTSKLNLQPE